MKLKTILALAISLLPVAALATSTRVTINNMTEAQKVLDEKAKKYGAENVLVVFDIDHTLLTTVGDLGSSYWFGWQSELIKTPEKEADQLFDTFPELVSKTANLFCAVQMRPVEKTTNEFYAGVQKAKFPMFVLTARSSEMRETTERDLLENHFTFPSPVLGKEIKEWKVGKDAFIGDLTPEEIKASKLESPTPVSYLHGIMMANGQDKGALIRAFLVQNNLKDKIKAVILIDDSKSNVDNLDRNFANVSIDATSVHYLNEKERFDEFKAGATWSAISEWDKAKKSKIYTTAKNGHCRK